jgi:3-deoxy-D-manno-octulosonic-acid transferase
LNSTGDSTGRGAIWFHAVSVGEVLSAAEIMRRIREQDPHIPVFLSTSTLTGRALADHKIGKNVFFAPLDYRSCVRRVLRRLRPSVVVILETEIWPNLYRESKRAGTSLLMVNARISDRAFPKYLRWRWFFRHPLQFPDAILAQSEQDRRRFETCGATNVTVAGNLKYDLPAPAIAPEIARFLDRVAPRKIWIAASTMSHGTIDEDDVVISALPAQEDFLLILAPRKPERFDLVAQKLERAAIPYVRRSRGLDHAHLRLPGVLLLDSIGELAALFARADVVFMGGTLADRGGHNILEPAFFGKPVIVGPHMENFAAIASEFHDANALFEIDSPAQLPSAVTRLMENPSSIGERARELAESRRGAILKILEEIQRARQNAIPNPQRTLPARAMLTPLSWLWSAGNRVNALRPVKTLRTPVISVGALTMGGAGKSPVVAHLARRLRETGSDPAILTRGYKRASREPATVPRGAQADRATTGDEAAIFISRGDAHVGIGADRYAIGRAMEDKFSPDVFLLDDGFQHRRLARTHDIVLLDAADPFAGGVFPLGRLREPLESLARADTILLTRCAPGQDTSAIERMLARYNAQSPVFRSRVVAVEWVGLAGCLGIAGKAAAFCGLGDPRSFWRTLDELGIETVWRREFMDHHSYSPSELKQLAAGVDTLLTTEKDAMNLPPDAAQIVAPCRLFWLKIDIEIDNEDAFLSRIRP